MDRDRRRQQRSRTAQSRLDQPEEVDISMMR